jgi:hypothetical protein
MSDFIEGPWVLGGDAGDGKGADGYVYCDNNVGSAVAICFGDKLGLSVFSRKQEIANARLISAAPDFHDASDDLLQLFHGDDDICPAFSRFLDGLREEDAKAVRKAVGALQAAIDKADGQCD